MYRHSQVADGGRPRLSKFGALLFLLLGRLLFLGAAASAQTTFNGPIARIMGQDISVENGNSADSSAGAEPGILISNGSVVTVHSGEAQMTFLSGGEVDICGPAKFTLLQSGAAITLALDFGRLHAELPASTSFRVFTPTINATPVGETGASRDVTLGLYLNDSLCVRATQGALLLEHQFSGDKMVVPQNGEFFLDSGKLEPVVGTPGSCQCKAGLTQSTTGPAPAVVTETAPREQAPPEPQSQRLPDADYREQVLSQRNESHPVAQATKRSWPEAPPLPGSANVASMPPLSFSATSPNEPRDPTGDIVLLVRTARVQPEWDFSGHVDAPSFASALQQQLGEGPRSSPRSTQQNMRLSANEKSRGGFWAKLKRVFTGEPANNKPKQCEGIGCG